MLFIIKIYNNNWQMIKQLNIQINFILKDMYKQIIIIWTIFYLNKPTLYYVLLVLIKE